MALIYFSSKTNSYKEFSNFYASPFTLDGKKWSTVEHYFQAMKFAEEPMYQEEVRNAAGAGKAKVMGASRKHKLRDDWEEVKETVMMHALEAKFDQHPYLTALLKSTKDATLCEWNPKDSYWAWGLAGEGKNRLGALLMELRDRPPLTPHDLASSPCYFRVWGLLRGCRCNLLCFLC